MYYLQICTPTNQLQNAFYATYVDITARKIKLTITNLVGPGYVGNVGFY